MWKKYVNALGFLASAVPALSPGLVRTLSDKLKKFCFPAGTEVAVEEGVKPIEEIREGDWVWSQDDQTGEVGLRQVKQLFVNVAASLVVLHCGTNTLEATPPHPLWVADVGWKAASQVQVGDALWTRGGERVVVTGITHKQGQFTVYNFEVDDFHTYFVGKDRVLGHNAPCPTGPGRLGTLTKIGENAWESSGGLRFVGLDRNGLNRVEHVLRHVVAEGPGHSVFNVARNKLLSLLDEAYTSLARVPVAGDPAAFIIRMGRVVGTAGENAVKLILRPGTSEVISAYPVFIP